MIVDRDKLILKWIEDYKAITLKQATALYFNNCYKGASRRMNQLEEMGLIKLYISKTKKKKCILMKKKYQIIGYIFMTI
ncbi:hypothetical protein [Clostridium gasigenes]|uniref:hypothetical protein n=1 Tax=Clostridium gasigenes TaxID=94869 RepID=UPI00209B7250|nr:hypothetical protein [Clostridium gasigenes]